MKATGRRATATGALAIAMVLGFMGGAVAATVTSSVGGMGTHSGASFWDQSIAGTSSAGYATTDTWTSKVLPTGYIGSEARLYLESGALCRTSGMYYIPQSGSGWSKTTWRTSPTTCGGAGNYYSRGKSAAWNDPGGPYSYYWAFSTPYLYIS